MDCCYQPASQTCAYTLDLRTFCQENSDASSHALTLDLTPWGVLSVGLVVLFSLFLFLTDSPPSPAFGLALLAALPVITAWQTVLGEPGAPFTTLLVSMPPVCSNFHLFALPSALAPDLSLLRTCTSITHSYTTGRWVRVDSGRLIHWF